MYQCLLPEPNLNMNLKKHSSLFVNIATKCFSNEFELFLRRYSVLRKNRFLHDYVRNGGRMIEFQNSNEKSNNEYVAFSKL